MTTYKRIGILGGLSPESTITYYEYITRTYRDRFGDHGYPEILIYSLSFQEFMDWMKEGRWDLITDKIVEGISRLHKGGADFGLIATNTMHAVFDEVEKRSPMPLISIIDATADEVKKEHIKVVGLLGTEFTMSGDFYKKKLMSYSVQTLVPEKEDRKYINRVIFEELVNGQVLQRSRKNLIRIVEKLKKRGAQGVILGCTELPLLIREEDVDIKLFNTTIIHAERALIYAISGK